MMQRPVNILSFSHEELTDLLTGWGENAFRANQLWQWLWQKRVQNFQQMSNLPQKLRGRLDEMFTIFWPRPEKISRSQDGTVKFLLQLKDGAHIESVLIPEKTHYTLCISSQVGCALGCTFCCTGKQGFTRNLAAWEIAAQALVAQEYLDKNPAKTDLKNLVMMGMGEPLLNWDEVQKSFTLLGSPEGLNFSRRRMTLSSVGINGPLQSFAKADIALPAISLHAPSQKLRQKIMPGASRALDLDKLIKILKTYPLRPRERITIEYILLGNVNDSPDHARQLVRLLSGLRCKINLIAYNEGAGNGYKAPTQEGVLAFEKILWDKGMTAVLRKSKGADIAAACGQLSAREKQ